MIGCPWDWAAKLPPICVQRSCLVARGKRPGWLEYPILKAVTWSCPLCQARCHPGCGCNRMPWGIFFFCCPVFCRALGASSQIHFNFSGSFRVFCSVSSASVYLMGFLCWTLVTWFNGICITLESHLLISSPSMFNILYSFEFLPSHLHKCASPFQLNIWTSLAKKLELFTLVFRQLKTLAWYGQNWGAE